MPTTKKVTVYTKTGKGSRKTRYARRRVMRQGMFARSALSAPRSDVHMFKRWTDGGVISGNVAYNPYLASFSYNLGALPNVSEFTTLFDQYMITKVITKMWLKIDPSAQTGTSASYPRLYVARDYDTSSTPGSLNELRQYARCRVLTFNPTRPIVLVSKPNTLALSYTSAVASNYTPKWKQWLDVSDTSTVHYGWLYAIDDLTNTNYKVTIEHTYYFKCKNTR